MEEIVLNISRCAESGALVASWDDPTGFGGLTTQAYKVSELEGNIRDAIAVHFDPEELPVVRLRYAQ